MISASQCRAARALLDWSQQALAEAAAVGVVTIRQFEGGGSVPRRSTLTVVQKALEAAGVEFISENGGGAGVRLKKASKAHDLPKPTGPATDVVDKMDAAIEEHRSGGKK